jgi:hypothetical protein
MKKCDYLKGVTAGLALAKRLPRRFKALAVHYAHGAAEMLGL